MKKKVMRIFVLIGLLIILGINAHLVPLIGDDHDLYGTPSFPAFSAIFILGGLFYELEKQLKLNLGIAVIVFGFLMIIARHSELYRFSIFAFTIVFLLWIATRRFIIDRLPIKHDYSYGVYLYGWPAQQIADTLLRGYGLDSAINIMCIAIPIALCLAALSWHLIEKPALDIAHHVTRIHPAGTFKTRLQRWLLQRSWSKNT